VNIRFSPTLTDEDIRREAVDLIVLELERKAAEEQLAAARAEQEKDALTQDIPTQVSVFFLIDSAD